MLYHVNNITGSVVVLVDEDGNSVAIGGTATISLSAGGYQQAVRIFGIANVSAAGEAGNAPYVFTAMGIFTVPVGSTVVPLAPPAGATIAQLQVSNVAIRYRDDGVDPTSSVGIEIAAGGSAQLSLAPLTNVRMISEAGTATVTISYYS